MSAQTVLYIHENARPKIRACITDAVRQLDLNPELAEDLSDADQKTRRLTAAPVAIVCHSEQAARKFRASKWPIILVPDIYSLHVQSAAGVQVIRSLSTPTLTQVLQRLVAKPAPAKR